MPTATATATARRLALACSILLLAACGSPSTPAPPPVPAAFTLHFHRALSDYAGWTVETTAGAVEASVSSSSTDGFGAVYTLNVAAGAADLAFTLKNAGVSDGSGALSVVVSGTIREAWVFSGFAEAITRRLPAIPTAIIKRSAP